MAKGSFIQDTVEQGLELINTSSIKQNTKTVSSMINPVKLTESALGIEQIDPEIIKQEKLQKSYEHSSPLPLDKLNAQEQDQEKVKMDQLRNKLFSLVKKGDEESLERSKKADQEKKQKSEQEEQLKKKKEHDRLQQEANEIAPSTKQKRGVMNPKKRAQQSNIEIKSGKSKD